MKKIILFRIVSILYLGVGTASSFAQTFEFKSHTNASISNYSMPYRLFIPDGYDPGVNYPLVLFLHGAGERGTDNTSHIAYIRGATLWAEEQNQAENPCFVVAPQCPNDKQWVNTNWSSGSYSIDEVAVSKELLMAKDIIDSLLANYAIDPNRMYVTGLSMGGYGTWDFILRYPEMFKGAIPICGAGDPSKAELIKNIPLRVFHSSDDYVVPVSGSRDMVSAINAIGPNNRTEFYTEYTNVGHFAWENGYNTEDLASWLLTAKPVILNCNDSTVPVVSIDQSEITLFVNDTFQLNATVLPDGLCNNNLTWTSSNSNLITVNKKGFIICKGQGKIIITATSNQGGATATCEVTVTGINRKYEAEKATLYGITVYNNHNDYSGTGFVAPFLVKDDFVEFTIQNAEAGEQNIILRYSNGYSEDRKMSLYINGERIKQVILPNTSDWEHWGDHVEKVVLNEGDNTIRYQFDEGDNGMFNIDYLFVKSSVIWVEPVTGVTLSTSALTLEVNDDFELLATVIPPDASNNEVSWTSSNTSVATVSAAGLVTALAAGTATITVTTTEGGLTSTCDLIVKEPDQYLQQAGIAYRWSANSNSSSNSNRVADPGLNDGILSVDIGLKGSQETFPNAYEAAGLIFSTAKTITKVEYINGKYEGGYDDGCFEGDFKLQVSEDGTTWNDAIGWNLSPDYEYLSPSVGGATFTFTGISENILGIRVTGKVRTSETTGSWEVRAREFTAYSDSSQNTYTPIILSDSDYFIFPNPASSILTIANLSSNTSIKVISMDGRVIKNIVTEKENEIFEVSQWEKGVYFFQIKTKSNIVTRKVVIQ